MKKDIQVVTFDDLDTSTLPKAPELPSGEWEIVGGRLGFTNQQANYIKEEIEKLDELDEEVQISSEAIEGLYDDLFPKTEHEEVKYRRDLIDFEPNEKLREAFFKILKTDSVTTEATSDGNVNQIEKAISSLENPEYVQSNVGILEKHADKFSHIKWIYVSMYQEFNPRDINFLIDFKNEIQWDVFFEVESRNLGLRDIEKLISEGIEVNWGHISRKSKFDNWSKEDFNKAKENLIIKSLWKNKSIKYISPKMWQEFYSDTLQLHPIELVESSKLPYINRVQDLTLLGYEVSLQKCIHLPIDSIKDVFNPILKEVFVDEEGVYIEEHRCDTPIISLYKIIF